MRRSLDLLIGLAAILAPALLLLADQVVAALPPHNHIKITPGLIGVTLPSDLAPTPGRILDGSFQASFAKTIGARSPIYPFAVRLKDQILFSAFGMSGIPAIAMGQGGALIERDYLTEYCSRDPAAFRRAAAEWAPKIRQMQDAYERRGKTFLYVITPSKIAQYPALMPRHYPCPATAADRAGLLPAWRAALEAAGVHYVDTTLPLSAAHGRYSFPLYPRGGTHWNAVGAAIATQAIAAGLDALRGDGLLPPPDFTWAMAQHPAYPDDDLASLMNLLVADRNYPVPRITLTAPAPAAGCHPLTVVIVGGSFMNRPGEYLQAGPCHPHVEEWQYWTVFDITWPAGDAGKTRVDPPARDASLRAADVVIFEENEQVAARSSHGPALYAFIQQEWGFEPGRIPP